jgi:hypothetical protein
VLSDKRLSEIRELVSKASPAPWNWAYAQGEVPTDEPELLKLGIDTISNAPCNIQLQANGHHRFWIELTDTKITGDVVFDLDFIKEARVIIPELLAEVERLRGLLGRDLH